MADAALRPLPGHAFHYRDTGSPLHRLGGGWKLLGVALAGAAAVASREPAALACLLATLAAGYRLARLTLAELWQEARCIALGGWAAVAIVRHLRDHGIIEEPRGAAARARGAPRAARRSPRPRGR